MANYTIKFHGTKKSNTLDYELECYRNKVKEITISIENKEDFHQVRISLDIPTAIKFSKSLRTLINEIKSLGDE